MRANVLVTETGRGLANFGLPQTAYLCCLALQAGALLIWWPSNTASFGGTTPLALFAVLIVLGVTLSYQCICVGAEELIFAGQQSLREWLIATNVPIWRLGLGYMLAHIIQTLHWMLLSIPVVLIAWSVDGGSWNSLLASLSVIMLVVSTYRLAGICIYLAVGQYGQLTWYCLRVLLFMGFVVSAVALPATNFWRLIDELLLMPYTGRQPDDLGHFLLFYAGWMLVFGTVTVIYARRIRARSIRSVA